MGINPAPKTVCLDFDGVLADYHGWKDEDTLDPPYPGAREFVEKVVEAGYTVLVLSTRKPYRICRWLDDHGFPPYVGVVREKPKAMVYIDDRAFRFTGDWDAAFEAIRQPTHWEE
jgi:adenylylsulfate kinase